MTTPDPAVSPAPDTEALRQQVEERLSWSPYEDVQRHRAEVIDAACALIVEREAGLRADLGQTRAERDRFADLHRGEARTHDETIASLNAARAEVERLRGIETASAGLVKLVKQCGGWPDTGLRSHFEQLQELRADVERLTAELARAGARPIPDDAAERPKNAAFLRWCEWPACLRSFDARTGPSEVDGKGWIYVRTGMHVLLCPDHANAGHRPQRFEWEQGDTTIRTACECGERSGDLTPTNHATCLEWWRAHVLGLSAPTTGPAPAAADSERPDNAVFDANGFMRPDVIVERWLDDEPAAPQAPAELTELPSSLLAATLTNLGITQAELARRTGISTKHINHVIKGKAGLGVDMARALAETTGVPAGRWLHAEANRLSGPAAREDTAPPDDDLHLPPGQARMIEFAALRCADVDNREWETLPVEDRDRYQGYVMAMLQVLPPHIVGELWAYLDKHTTPLSLVVLHEAARDDAAPPTPSDLQVAPTLGAGDNTATPGWAGHHVQVSASPIYEGSATAVCEESGCGALAGGRARDVEDWADAHRADTLRPSAPTEEV